MLEYARGLASQGHQVTWFASAFSGADLEEKYEGIRIIRQYSNHTIWLFAWLWYRNYKKTNPVDIILDEAGGWPLLSPFFEKNIPIYFFIHHIGEKEFSAYPFPVSALSRWIYRILI
jgi:Glycosyltransferase Family 4